MYRLADDVAGSSGERVRRGGKPHLSRQCRRLLRIADSVGARLHFGRGPPGDLQPGTGRHDRPRRGRAAGGGHLLVAFEVADAASITGKLVDAGAQLDAAPTRTPFWVSPASSPSGLHDHRVPGAGRPAMIA